jgi:hypothetical protein
MFSYLAWIARSLRKPLKICHSINKIWINEDKRKDWDEQKIKNPSICFSNLVSWLGQCLRGRTRIIPRFQMKCFDKWKQIILSYQSAVRFYSRCLLFNVLSMQWILVKILSFCHFIWFRSSRILRLNTEWLKFEIKIFCEINEGNISVMNWTMNLKGKVE